MIRRKITMLAGLIAAVCVPLSTFAQDGDEASDALPSPDAIVGASPGDGARKEGKQASEAAAPPRRLGGVEEAKTETKAEKGQLPQREGWRVEASEEPPIQVRRAVDTVVGTAHGVAERMAGVPAGGSAQPPERLANKKNTKNDAKDDAASEVAEPGADAAETQGKQEKQDEGASDDAPRLRRVQRRWSDGRETGRDGADAKQSKPGDRLFDAARRLLERKPRKTLTLEAYVDDPRWDRAMKKLVDDDCREAIDIVDTIFEEAENGQEKKWRSTPAVEYAVARIKMCAGQRAEGRRTLERLAERDGPVGELAARRLGRSPSPIQVSATDPGAKGFWERLREAKHRVQKEGLDAGIGALKRLGESAEKAWQRYKSRMAEADLLLAHGRVADAARAFLGVYEMTRDWQIGDRVAERIEEVERKKDIQILPFGARVDRMRELIDRGKYSKAKRVSIQNAKIAGVSGQEIEGWSAYRRALEAEQKRRRERADELFEKAERLTENPIIRSRIYFGWARALRRLDRDPEAIELYERLCREYPRHHLCDDATFEAGRLHQYANQHKKARDKFVEVVGMHPDSEHVPDALWRGALSLYQLGQYEAVDRPLKRLLNNYGDQTDASGLTLGLKARYWLGAAAFKRGDLDVAKQRLQATINRGALTWYGALAAARLRKIGERPVIPMPKSDLSRRKVMDLTTLSIPKHERLEVAAEYARLGLYADAEDELNRQIHAGAPPEKARRLLGTVMLLEGDIPHAHWMMQKHIDPSAPTHYELRDWGIAYPLAFMEHAHKWGVKYRVSPFVVEAIMRQESAFKPAVASYVGAVGLMQLMPGTANWISDNLLDGEYYSRSELTDPANNVRLGTLYVRLLYEMTDHSIPMSLAGYNAGPAPLNSWFDRFGDKEIDVWTEMITYRQARAYVRKVYTSYVRYSALYGGGFPTLPLELPDDLKNWGEDPELQNVGGTEAVSMFR